MSVISFIILFPFFAALALPAFKKGSKVQEYALYISSIVVMVSVIVFAVDFLQTGSDRLYLTNAHDENMIIQLGEVFITGLIVYLSFKYKKYYAAVLSVVQTALVLWLELSGNTEFEGEHYYIVADRFTVVMVLIIGIVGSLICVYAAGYMRSYVTHHSEVKDRRSFFFSMLFVFLGAMFGLVFSGNMTWIYFFWEITSLCSFLLIGYTKTNEAVNNSFRALWMNLLGGLGFACAITYSALKLNTVELSELVSKGSDAAIIPVMLLAFAGFTKSAQFPFSKWLLGAMVAPTPTSALLHSATMVKAGVYLLLRLSPAFYGSLSGDMVTIIGGFTFLSASLLAIAQSDGKKVLAYSTISNLGLITACAGVGTDEAAWAGILLVIFHAVSKSMLFLSVGAVENSTGSRNIEDMHGLIVRLPALAFVMVVGIAGMFLAPFGMLISKWAALKSFVDSNSILLIIFLVFGSASTLFYWTKWLGTLVCVTRNSHRQPNKLGKGEWVSLITHAVIMIALCITFPIVSKYLIVPLLTGMFGYKASDVIGGGNVSIMLMMLSSIAILPIALRVLTFGKKDKIVMSYMSGINEGNDREFVDSFGNARQLYLTNWYMEDYFGEKKLYKASVVFTTAVIAMLMIIAGTGVIK